MGLRVTTAPNPLSAATGYGVVLGVGALFALGMVFVTRALKKHLHEDNEKSETFMVANRNVGVGLTASAVISSWAWTTAMLSSATVTYFFGVAGAFWFASGCIVQISFFAFLGIHSKMKAPRAHTLLEIIRTRYGTVAHVVFSTASLINNIISVANMLLGASAVVSALTSMDVTAANFLLPLFVCVYTFFGGLKSTFLTDYVHTVIILVLIIYFGIMVFSNDVLKSPAHLWELVNDISAKSPVARNAGGSYFTLTSLGALEFGIIHTLGNFGLVIADTSFWQKAFAARPDAAVGGYILGAIAYWAIPFGMGTFFGLAGVALEGNPRWPTYPKPMTESDINNGLIVPFVAETLGGKGASAAVLILVFMAVTSTTSSQLIAVSSISAFDLYKTYINPRATDKQVVTASHIAVVGFGLFMAAFSTALFYGGVSLGWTIYMIGVIVCPAMFPILLTLLWDRQSKLAVIVAPIVGMAAGIAVWLSTSSIYGGGVITVATTGASLPCVWGTVTSAFVPLPITVIISLLQNEHYDWANLNRILLPGESAEDAAVRERDVIAWTSIELKQMRRGAQISGWFSLALFIGIWVVFPFPMYGSRYIFSSQFFTGWIRVGQIWTWFALSAAGGLPLWQGRHSIKIVVLGVLGLRKPESAPASSVPSETSSKEGSLNEQEKV